MQGILINIDHKKNKARIVAKDKLYTATVDNNTNDLTPGNFLEISIIKEPSLLSEGIAEIDGIGNYDLPFEETLIVTDKDLIEGHSILDHKNRTLIAAEGADAINAFKALIKRAKESNANALLNTKLKIEILNFSQKPLFRYTAEAAIIEGPQYHQKPGIKLDIKENIARRNSPNKAMIRYIRVLILCALLILIPCLLSLQQRDLLPYPLGSTLAIAVTLISIIGALFVSSRKVISYLSRN